MCYKRATLLPKLETVSCPHMWGNRRWNSNNNKTVILGKEIPHHKKTKMCSNIWGLFCLTLLSTSADSFHTEYWPIENVWDRLISADNRRTVAHRLRRDVLMKVHRPFAVTERDRSGIINSPPIDVGHMAWNPNMCSNVSSFWIRFEKWRIAFANNLNLGLSNIFVINNISVALSRKLFCFSRLNLVRGH